MISNEFSEWFEKHDEELLFMECEDIAHAAFFAGAKTHQCSVTDMKGNHCPEEANHALVFNGQEIHLCKRCFANVQNGAYSSRPTSRALDLPSAVACECGSLYGVHEEFCPKHKSANQ